ncbi:hypothetical protein GOODEAATRI_012974 [Goodea atripinnis]|uniref:Uncharacterized protein n=1 Tax=Goodea atripinnis TaxID=208336 RepID=A0ABV0MRR5_9TELE
MRRSPPSLSYPNSTLRLELPYSWPDGLQTVWRFAMRSSAQLWIWFQTKCSEGLAASSNLLHKVCGSGLVLRRLSLCEIINKRRTFFCTLGVLVKCLWKYSAHQNAF